MGKSVCVRCGVCVTQDVSVFEILDVGTRLEVLFEGFLALDGREGGGVDGGWGGHCLWGWSVRVGFVFDLGGEGIVESGKGGGRERNWFDLFQVGGATCGPWSCLGVCGELAAVFFLSPDTTLSDGRFIQLTSLFKLYKFFTEIISLERIHVYSTHKSFQALQVFYGDHILRKNT